MTKEKAIEYLIANEICSSEWAEAGMYHAIKEVVLSKATCFTKRYLDSLLKTAGEF